MKVQVETHFLNKKKMHFSFTQNPRNYPHTALQTSAEIQLFPH